MKSRLLLFLTLYLQVLISCEREENVTNREYITFTINNDYTYTLELTDAQNDSCEFRLRIDDNLTLTNTNCEAHDRSNLFFTITSFEAEQNIPVELHGSFSGSELEAILGFRIPYQDQQNDTSLVFFNMFNGLR